MARGNAWDGRLDRTAATAVLLIESLEKFRHKFNYAMVGHSGSTADLELVAFDRPPLTDADKYAVIEKIYGHANGCASGDNSMQAAELGIQDLVREDADDYFLFLLSDANLGRYDVSPQEMGKVLRSEERVNAYAIFIAEPMAAEWLKSELPFGHGLVALDLQQLPTTIKDVFAHATGL
eukprot:INCI9961.3.p1 GENE.INCI9961.3~~INCI9961.3.p1  ORF type:complete len:179 (+),score=34.28 INCI9961.3:295-831(+)